MVTYEFECKECKDNFKVEKSIHEAHPIKCEKCGGELKQIYGTTNEIMHFDDPRRGAISKRFL